MIQALTDDCLAQATTEVENVFTFVNDMEYEFVGGGNAVNGY